MRIWSLHPKYLDAKGLIALLRGRQAWVQPREIVKDLAKNPEKYTAWFPYIMENILGLKLK